MGGLDLDLDRDYERRFVARHRRKVDRSRGLFACWPWLGSINKNGYGTIRGGRLHISETGIRWIYQAHRVALAIATCPDELTVFQLMDNQNAELEAAHTCHWRPCCQPQHLLWKTHHDNILDIIERFGQLGVPANSKRKGIT